MIGRVAGLVLALAAPVAAAPGAAQVKYHQVVTDPDTGAVVAEFTTIRDVMPSAVEYPNGTRILYRDEEGGLLVIRDGAPREDEYVDSFECVASRETLTLEILPSRSMSIRVGGASVLIDLASIDPKASGAPRALIDQAAPVFRGISPGCRATLLRLSQRSAAYSTLLFGTVEILAALMFPATSAHVPRVDTTSGRLGVVEAFDPAQTPPGPFERPFGEAYYR